MFETIVLSKPVIIYFFSLFFIGVLLLFHTTLNKKKNILHVEKSNETWIEFFFLIWSILMLMFSVQQFFFKPTSQLPDPWNKVTLGFSMQIATLIFIILSIKYFPRLFDFPLSTKTMSTLNAIKQGIISFLEALPLIVIVTFGWNFVIKIWNNFGIILPLKRQELVDLFTQSDSKPLIYTIIIFGTIIAPITEELIFRGAIYRFLKSKISPLLALSISALVFAWVHCNILSFLPLLLIGLLLARSYEKTGHILTPIVFHSLFNANTLVLLLLNPNFNLMHS